MNVITLPLLYILSGFFMKLSDDFYDEKNYKGIAIVLGVICGLATACASLLSFDAACIFIAILLGNIIALKVDGIHHVVTMATFLIIFVIGGLLTIYTGSISTTTLIVLIVCIVAAFIDEMGNDNDTVYSLGKPFEIFFEYRCTMKVAILILALCGGLSLWSFVFFICFELAYEFARIIFNKFFL